MTTTIGFIIEQGLGHITHGLNLKQHVPADNGIHPLWGFPQGRETWLYQYPGFRNWTVQMGLQTRHILHDMARHHKLDGLFFHTQVTAVLVPDWLRRIPSVISLDATPMQIDSLGEAYGHQTGSGRGEKFKWRLNQAAYQAARHLVVWSDWTKQSLIHDYHIEARKISVIPPGVDVKIWRRSIVRNTYSNKVKILFVGGNLQRKGGHILLEAFRNLQQKKLLSTEDSQSEISIELHLVSPEATTEPGVIAHNNLKPNSEKLRQLYQECDIFCLPTNGDCLPMVLSEAGAAGMPAVTTKIAGIPEIIKEGKTGFLVPPNDVAALTQALWRLIENPRLRRIQGKNAQSLVTQNCNLEKNVKKLLEVLKTTIQSS